MEPKGGGKSLKGQNDATPMKSITELRNVMTLYVLIQCLITACVRATGDVLQAAENRDS